MAVHVVKVDRVCDEEFDQDDENELADEDRIEEEWVRVAEPGARRRCDRDVLLREVIAARDRAGSWHVYVGMASVVREDPLVSELVSAVTSAMATASGVDGLAREGPEAWAVWGTPSGERLVRAVAAAVDPLVPRALRLQTEASRAARRRDLRRLVRGRTMRLLTAGFVVLGVVNMAAGVGNRDLEEVVVGVTGVAFFGGGYLAALLLARGVPGHHHRRWRGNRPSRRLFGR